MLPPSEIFQEFFPDASIDKVERLGNGHINNTFGVHFHMAGKTHSVVLQQVNRNIFPSPDRIAQNIRRVAQHLRINGYRYEILDIQSTPGTPADDSWRVFPMFKDCISLLTCDNAEMAARSAIIFGHHFSCLANLEASSLNIIIPNFHNAAWRWNQFQESLAGATDVHKKAAAEAIEFCFDHLSLIDLFSELQSDLPPRVTHNDTKISNLLFDRQTLQPKVIIDLDTLQPGNVMSEFGDMVRSYCSSHGEEETRFDLIAFRPEIYLALKTAFLSETTSLLNTIEKEALNHAGAITIYVQGLRFLSDYLNGSVYYRSSYPEQNLHRAVNQQKLLEKMMAWQKSHNHSA